MSGVQTKTVEAHEDGLRLDRWFKSHFPSLGHGRLEKLLRTGQVRVDGGRAKAGHRLEEGQVIRVPPIPDEAPRPAQPRVNAADQAFLRDLVLHEDDALIVLNKPAGLAVQGGTGTTRHLDGMLDGLRAPGGERPRLVHRLDRDTSGILLLARSRASAQALTRSFKGRDVRKIYWGLVQGIPKPDHGQIKLAMRKMIPPGHDEQGERMVPAKPGDPEAKSAITLFATMAVAARKAAWLALLPVTGRTHQLRVHCTSVGTPLVGDFKYGYGQSGEPLGGVGEGLHLHAAALAIPHPDGGRLTVQAPLPPHMQETFALLGFDASLAHDPFPDDPYG